MKFSMLVPCGQCGNKYTRVVTTGDKPYPGARCNKCQTVTSVIDDGRVSRRAICRAELELLNKDWSLAIILGAMSVECELAYLYSKWRMLDAGITRNEVRPSDTELWGKAFRKLQSIERRLDGVTDLLTGEPFCSFLARRDQLSSVLRQIYPNVGGRSWMRFFVEELFHKRNSILHSGQMRFGEPEGEACVRMANSLLQIMGEIDKERYTRFDKELLGVQ